MGSMSFRNAYEFDPEDSDYQNAGGLPGMLWRAMQLQGALSPSVAATSPPAGTPGYDPNDYGSPQGGLLGRLLALQGEQSPYNGPSQGFAGTGIVGPQSPSDGAPPVAQASVAQPGQGSTPAGASAPSRQLSSRRVPIGTPMQHDAPPEGVTDSSYSPYEPKTYDSQGAGGLFGRLLAIVQPGGVQPSPGSAPHSEFDLGASRDPQGGLIGRLRTLQQQQSAYQPTKPMMDPRRFELAQAVTNTSQKLGINPQDLATAISYETGGTFNPNIWGGKDHKYYGLIQLGPEERKDYGANEKQSITEQLQAVERFLRARGVRPNMGLLDIYSAINAGHVGLSNRSDANNGGAPGTVLDKVNSMAGHKVKAAALLNEYAQTVARQPGISTSAVFPDRAAPLFPSQGP
jgi:hypothetical protein